jgi:hypothetical protein
MTLWTASRPGMVRHAEWVEIDFDKALWTVPAVKMKMRKAHVVPLPTQLLAALRELHQLTGRGRYLFPGIGTKHPILSENTINLVFSKIGYKGRLVGHGTRHTASTLLREHNRRRFVFSSCGPIMLIAHRFRCESERRATTCFDICRRFYSVAGIAGPRRQARATKAAAPSISGE